MYNNQTIVLDHLIRPRIRSSTAAVPILFNHYLPLTIPTFFNHCAQYDIKNDGA